MTRIVPEMLSARFRVCDAAHADADEIYALYRSDREYFEYFSLDPTRERLTEDMTMLPEGCAAEQKHFLVYYDDGMVALLDLIEGYPDERTCYIGLFMVDSARSRRGIGSGIISELCEALSDAGFDAIRLAYGKRYAPGVRFWSKNGFVPLKEAELPDYGELIVAERKL